MKKSALALAVAAALVGFGSTAYADTTLYGSARVSVDYVDDGNVDANWDVKNNSSRLGVRGEEDLGGGLSAIYQYEFGVDVTEGTSGFESNRPKWVGLKGTSWGSITAGTQWTPYYNVLGIADIFNSNRPFANRSVYLGTDFGTRMDNSLIYTSPNWSGFSAQAMLVMNGDVANSDPQTPSELTWSSSNKLPANLSDGVDMWNISASYKNGPFFAGATYMALEGSSFNGYITAPTYDGDQWGLAFGYNQGPFALTINYEDGDVNSLYYGGATNVYVTGQYTFGNNIIRAAYGYVSPDKSRITGTVSGVPVTILQDDIDNYIVGYQYNFSKRTRVWAEYIGQSVDTTNSSDSNIVSIGTRVDF